jgi:hypothetical protein
MLWFQKNPSIKRKTVLGETLSVDHPNLVTFLIKSTFEGCDISLNCPARGLIIDRCAFRDCIIRAKKPQANHQLFTSTFERCRFLGKFPGCEFGFRIDLHGKTKGTIADCDFREAILDGVTFNNCEIQSISLPRWPHFTLLDPAVVAARIPNPLGCPELEALRSVALRRDPITRSVAWYAPTFTTRSLYNEPQLRELLSTVEGVLP